MCNGYGGVISFGLNTDDKTVEKFCAALKVVTFAVSLGHDESLIFPSQAMTKGFICIPGSFRMDSYAFQSVWKNLMILSMTLIRL